MNIHTQQLRYFMELADCLNFTKAAAKLYVAQPTLSQQISELESQMGVSLFTRNSRSVTLTPAGQILKEASPNILAALESVHQQMLVTAAGLRGCLRIGFVDSFLDMFPTIIQKFSEAYPDIEIFPVSSSINGLNQALQNGSIDVALTVTTVLSEDETDSLTRKHLQQDPMCYVISKEDPFFTTGCQDFSLLERSRLVTFSDDRLSGNTAFCTKIMYQQGLTVPKMILADNLNSIRAYLESGLGFGILPQSLSRFFADFIAFIPIENTCVSFGVAWHPEHSNPVTPLFLEVLEDLCDSYK